MLMLVMHSLDNYCLSVKMSTLILDSKVNVKILEIGLACNTYGFIRCKWFIFETLVVYGCLWFVDDRNGF